jgi:hypothetical protein
MTCVAHVQGSGVCADRADRAPFLVEVEDDVVRRVDVPEVSLAIETEAVGAFEHARTLTPRSDERAIGLELDPRVIAPIERDNVAVRRHGDAAETTYHGVRGIVEEVLHQMDREGGNGRSTRRLLRLHHRNGKRGTCRHRQRVDC